MHPDLVKLLDLQEKDLALVEVDTRLTGILGEIDRLDKELADAERNLESRRRSAAEALRKRQESETKIENYRRLLERQQARTDQLRGQREIQAAMTEMDLARSVLAKEENDWAHAGDHVIAQDAAARAAEERLEEQRASQAEAREAIGQRMTAVQAERDQVKSARDASASEVERVLRQRYERLRTARVARVVVPLAGSACGACFTTIPFNRRSQIRSGNVIDWCESCGVILYYPDDQGA
ncbi:MAG TPA: C4-type zinc ribbon domain-containing protein [Gemmatimonadales bacterium]|nr:C4-type zinc ribbon domain-containing protein [Gemmatimonadales bacterium]